LRRDGFQRIAGVDEAGRGPLAGPVVAAAVVLPNDWKVKGVNDSKQLGLEQREELYALIVADADVGVGMADVDVIDRLNIRRATWQAMQDALRQLSAPPDHVLIDGVWRDPCFLPYTAVVKGDAKSLSIAAASIVAKVTRDRWMQELDAEFPIYGFAQHKGYPTSAHVEALRAHGPCPAHRCSFAPVREWMQRRLFESGEAEKDFLPYGRTDFENERGSKSARVSTSASPSAEKETTRSEASASENSAIT
jgi:ribonuclease HII